MTKTISLFSTQALHAASTLKPKGAFEKIPHLGTPPPSAIGNRQSAIGNQSKIQNPKSKI
jgi:hypothetical protein